jgi:hypothetical protein
LALPDLIIGIQLTSMSAIIILLPFIRELRFNYFQLRIYWISVVLNRQHNLSDLSAMFARHLILTDNPMMRASGAPGTFPIAGIDVISIHWAHI